MCIIIKDLHQFIGPYLIPLNPWLYAQFFKSTHTHRHIYVCHPGCQKVKKKFEFTTLHNENTSLTLGKVYICISMDVEYTWILWQERNCRQFRLLTRNSFIWSVCLSSRRRGVGVNGVDGGIILLDSCDYTIITWKSGATTK